MVSDMIKDITENAGDLKDKKSLKNYILKILDREVFDKKGLVYGMGHAVYTKTDPRTVILTEYGQRVGFSAEGPVVNGRWALPVTLPQGNSTLEVHAVNGAGNRSPSVPLSFYVDSLAPEIVASTPANGTAVSAASSIVLTLDEATALDTNASSIVLESGNWTIPCSWSVNASELTIRPSFALTDGSYRLKATLADTFENLASNTLEFSIDSTHPSPPVVVPLPSPVTQQRVTVTGTKGPGEAILLNGREAVPHTPSTEWSVEVELAEGLNTLSFTARNRAGNISEPTRLDLVYDNVAPAPITTLRAVPQASGTDIIISWTYPEPLDFKEYRIFVSTKAFEDIAGLTPREILGPGSESFKISGLERNITYYLAVVPVDTSGHFISRVTPVKIGNTRLTIQIGRAHV